MIVDKVELPWTEDLNLNELKELVGTWYASVLNSKAIRESGQKDHEYEAHLAVQVTGTEILKWVSSHIINENLKWRP